MNGWDTIWPPGFLYCPSDRLMIQGLIARPNVSKCVAGCTAEEFQLLLISPARFSASDRCGISGFATEFYGDPGCQLSLLCPGHRIGQCVSGSSIIADFRIYSRGRVQH